MDVRQWFPVAGLGATIALAGYMVAQLHAQVPVADLSTAAIAEVRDAQGQVVLRGQFVVVDEDDDDLERKAALQPTGVDADAAGEAEVEISGSLPVTQEVELSIRNLESGATYAFLIDVQEVAMVTTDRRGRAEVELNLAAANN